MNTIKCPHCGEAFTVDEAGYAAIAKQVRDDEFQNEIMSREFVMEQEKQSAIKLVTEQKDGIIRDLNHKIDEIKIQSKVDISSALSESEKDNEKLKQQIREMQIQNKVDIQNAVAAEKSRNEIIQNKMRDDLMQKNSEKITLESEKNQEIALLRRELAEAKEREKAAVQSAVQSKESEISGLKSQLENEKLRNSVAIEQVKSEKEKEIMQLKAGMEKEEIKRDLERKNEETKYLAIISEKEKEIELYRDMKTRLSTKMVGETLEQHCEIEFNKIRMMSFPYAYFEKDNEVKEGTKGDYIFRDFSPDGIEYISIMFEMKNEVDTTATKHKNEDFFNKLDKDRKKKGCEYAVLVSMLEQDNELYNSGIVDVSYKYEKMYVIRPQFFIPLISLLTKSAQSSITYRQQIVELKNRNIDVENFFNGLNEFKDKFSRNCRLAEDHFGKAIKEIDATIARLTKVREELVGTSNNLRLAESKADDLTIKRLTKGNKTMQDAFIEAGIDPTRN